MVLQPKWNKSQSQICMRDQSKKLLENLSPKLQ